MIPPLSAAATADSSLNQSTLFFNLFLPDRKSQPPEKDVVFQVNVLKQVSLQLLQRLERFTIGIAAVIRSNVIIRYPAHFFQYVTGRFMLFFCFFKFLFLSSTRFFSSFIFILTFQFFLHYLTYLSIHYKIV